MFLSNSNGELFQFNLASPFDLKGLTYEAGSETSYGAGYYNFAFNNDGTKLFSLNGGTKNFNSVKDFFIYINIGASTFEYIKVCMLVRFVKVNHAIIYFNS